MSLEIGILGFLEMKPLSGYDLKKLFNVSASFFWPADQAQIYRTLKKLVRDGYAELSACKKGETVDKKVYALTESGQALLNQSLSETSVNDFLPRDPFLLHLFFSGTLTPEEQLQFIDTQLENVKALEQQLIANYNDNYPKYLTTTGLHEDDPRLRSAVSAYRWGLKKCDLYAALLNELKVDMTRTRH